MSRPIRRGCFWAQPHIACPRPASVLCAPTPFTSHASNAGAHTYRLYLLAREGQSKSGLPPLRRPPPHGHPPAYPPLPPNKMRQPCRSAALLKVLSGGSKGGAVSYETAKARARRGQVYGGCFFRLLSVPPFGFSSRSFPWRRVAHMKRLCVAFSVPVPLICRRPYVRPAALVRCFFLPRPLAAGFLLRG